MNLQQRALKDFFNLDLGKKESSFNDFFERLQSVNKDWPLAMEVLLIISGM